MQQGRVVRIISSGEVGINRGEIAGTGVHVIEVRFSPIPETLSFERTSFLIEEAFVRATEGNLVEVGFVDQIEDRRAVILSADFIALDLNRAIGCVRITAGSDGCKAKLSEKGYGDSEWQIVEIEDRQLLSVKMRLIRLGLHKWRPQDEMPWRSWNTHQTLYGCRICICKGDKCLLLAVDDQMLLEKLAETVRPLFSRRD